MTKKTCCRCNQEYNISEFWRDPSKLDGHRYECKYCASIPLEIISIEEKQCSRCGKIKSVLDFHKQSRSKDGYKSACRVCRNLINKLDARNRRSSIEYQELERERSRTYYKNNRERYLEATRKWNKTPKGRKIKSIHFRRYKDQIKNSKNTLQPWHIDLLLILQNNECAKCHTSFEQVKYEMDHIVPVIHNGETTIDNIQLLCHSCNMEKFTKSLQYRENVSLYYSELT